MSWLSDIFIPSGNQTSAEQEANYARQQQQYQDALNAREQAGSIDQNMVDFYNLNRDRLMSQDAAAAQGLAEGAAQGARNVATFATDTLPGAIHSTLSGTVGALFKSIPISVWLLAGVALFFWMGGLALLKGRLKRS